ncbi:hypothetical protein ACT18_15560 [Mycolicibacter kumamotonensis]|uniref:Uncharacterized protein n=1 Tax=Mycolicibacter kumamotonensis TaxID=354243 RepID=A0A1B8SDS4_9MYCO|nr:hypothetical protein ACT18_15560 [Mycolicibacter kumamotonensis]
MIGVLICPALPRGPSVASSDRRVRRITLTRRPPVRKRYHRSGVRTGPILRNPLPVRSPAGRPGHFFTICIHIFERPSAPEALLGPEISAFVRP